MEALLEHARRGADFLDRELGRGWRRKIGRRRLNMAAGGTDGQSCGCILAQLDERDSPSGYGNYMHYAYGLNIHLQELHDLGFLISDDANDDAWNELTQAWLTVLREG